MIYQKFHTYLCEVTFDLLDAGNVVYHPNYLVLCDRARTQSIKDAGSPAHELWNEGLAFAVRENTSEYFRPARVAQELAIITHITEFSAASLNITQRIFLKSDLPPELHSGPSIKEIWVELDPKKMLYQVKLRLVCIRLPEFKPTRLPDRLIEALQLPSRGEPRGRQT